MAAAVGMIAGCQKPEMVQISAPENVVAPVLEAVEGPIEITAANMALESVVFNWSAADQENVTFSRPIFEGVISIGPARASRTGALTSSGAAIWIISGF